MFDIAWSEMVLIGAVALVVIGPKDLPKALRTVGQTVARVRRMATEFQGQFNDAMREAELADLKKQVEDVGGSVQSALNTDFKPIDQIKDFDAPKPDDAALKEAEAKLAALPAPAPLPPVEIKPETPKPAEAPKRGRKAKAAEVAPTAVETSAAQPPAVEPPKAARAPRKPKAVSVAAATAEPAAETAKPARKRKTAKGEETHR
ncbi:Sec-independent protein translocase protein TatB [Hyphomicrobiales bacterium]|nr:Sec-independent protein translocase protein TatB [Hyphomicrobiales bacterium]CAH1701219.1 Sec-independent protein translocase protein TatB [Hyphomicrobiales bacterium]CAI0345183.1 Sec-independent protein translocase protein TatB [Hyphomicrobiales bacterium]